MSAEKVVLALWCAALMTILSTALGRDSDKHLNVALRVAAALMFLSLGTLLLAIMGLIR